MAESTNFIHAIIDEAYVKAKSLLLANIGKLHFIAEYLLAHEDMDGDLFKAVMESDLPCGSENSTEPDVTTANAALNEQLAAMVEEKEKASREANEKRAQAEAARRAVEKALNDTEIDNVVLDEEELGDDESKPANPFDYSLENNDGKNPFDYNDDDKKDNK